MHAAAACCAFHLAAALPRLSPLLTRRLKPAHAFPQGVRHLRVLCAALQPRLQGRHNLLHQGGEGS